MSVARGAHPIDADRERDLTALLYNGEFASAVSAYDREDCNHEVPYGGGSGTDWRTIYWDHRICAAIDAGQFRVGDKAIDPRVTGAVHEAIEGAVLHLWDMVRQLLGWPETEERYPRAHDVADIAERHAVANQGWDWNEYQAEWERLIDPIEKAPIKNPPDNLLLDPYRGTKIFAELAALSKAPQFTQPGKSMAYDQPMDGRARFMQAIERAKLAQQGSQAQPQPQPQEAMQAMQSPPAMQAPPANETLAHGRAIAGAKALHAVGHISEMQRDKHVRASQKAIAQARKPFGSFAP